MRDRWRSVVECDIGRMLGATWLAGAGLTLALRHGLARAPSNSLPMRFVGANLPLPRATSTRLRGSLRKSATQRDLVERATGFEPATFSLGS